MATSPDKSAAVLTVKDAQTMTPEGKKEIARWLRRQAKMLEQEGANYADLFTARYCYREGEAI